MHKRFLLIGLMGIALVALFVAEVSARVCIYRNPITGACKLWSSGSVLCGISATGLGNCEGVSLGCWAEGAGDWVVACGNPGENKWPSPGINKIPYPQGAIGGQHLLNQRDCDKNGNTYVYVTAHPDAALLKELDNAGACDRPNPQWSPIDAVPCELWLTDVECEDGCKKSDALLWCTLDDCDSLKWDSKAQGFEKRQYDCTLVETTTYRVPDCFAPECR